jgi:hypothetical protein
MKRNAMIRLNKEEGRYRVLLISIGDNTEEEKDNFCHHISKNYNIPFPLLKKIIDRTPIVLKKNLTLRKAEILAKTLRAFGALVSVEERRDFPPVFLEFQELVPHQLDLESSYLRKTQRGVWNVIGRVKNISDEELNDTWILIQLFDDFDEFVTFEEIPLPVNPLPVGEASPFKVIIEGGFPLKKISIGFKNASGQPIAALDKRKKREWVKVETEDEDEHFFSSAQVSTKVEDGSQSIELDRPAEKMVKEEDSNRSKPFPEQEAGPLFGEPLSHTLDEESSTIRPESLNKEFNIPLKLTKENEGPFPLPVLEELNEGIGGETILNELEPPIDREEIDGSQFDLPVIEESIRIQEDRSKSDQKPPIFPWIENFRDSVETFYQRHPDFFSIWFEEGRKENEFKNSLHSILTILVHSRFDQGNQPVRALENTQRVFRFITHPNLILEDIPNLEGTPFVSGEVWRDLFHRAIPKIQQIGNKILEKKKWNAFDLEPLIQVIPHMGYPNSRKAIQWINKLIPDVIEVDLSDAFISIGESLYRVASRLGIVDPHFDYYQGPHSMGDIKIQSFAKLAFPQNPMKSEEPMVEMGRGGRNGGHCFPTQPQCKECLYEAFCPKLYFHFNPSEKGMRE